VGKSHVFMMPWEDAPGGGSCVLESHPDFASNFDFPCCDYIIDLVRLIGGCLNSFF